MLSTSSSGYLSGEPCFRERWGLCSGNALSRETPPVRLYCSAAAETQVTCADSERLLIKGKKMTFASGSFYSKVCAWKSEKDITSHGKHERSLKRMQEKAIHRVVALFHYAWQEKAAQRLRGGWMGLGEWGQERDWGKLTLISHELWPKASSELLCVTLQW